MAHAPHGGPRIHLALAGRRVGVETAPGLDLAVGPEHAGFLAPAGPTDLTVRFEEGPREAPSFARGTLRFSAHQGAVAFHARPAGPGWVVEVASGRRLRCEASFEEDWSQGVVRMTPWPAGRTLQTLPRVYEHACVSRLARLGGGMLVHAAGFLLPGLGGVLVPASSGGGKSTLAQLHPVERCLSDERVALVAGPGERAWIHGTPWRGTAARIQAAGGPLAAVVFLGAPSRERGLRRLGRAEAFQRLVFHGFPPYWDRAGLSACLDLARDTARRVPAYELRYAPGADVPEWLADLLAREVGCST